MIAVIFEVEPRPGAAPRCFEIAGYRLRVATVVRDYGMLERDQAPPDSQSALI